MRLAIIALVFVRLAGSQTFEVASVKSAHPAEHTARFTMKGGPETGDPGRISYTNIPLLRVLLSAYDVKLWQVSGPDWLGSLRFDIVANVPEGATKEQCQAMMRNLLVERFQMAIRRETRTLPIYALLPGKDGAKLKFPARPDAADDQIAVVKRAEGSDGFPELAAGFTGVVIETRNGRARLTSRNSPLAKLADFLSGQLGRPVIDVTGIPGNFDFDLYFAPEAINADAATDPGIVTALQQQLGLRLEARKGPVEMLVIDHANQVPTGN